MRLRHIFNILFLLLIFACNTKNERAYKKVYKDSVLKQYIDYTSKLPSTFRSFDNQFIKAYYTNDTLFLKKASQDIVFVDQEIGNSFSDSCKRHLDIAKLKVDEVYQFHYTQSHCELNYYFIITKNKDIIMLQSVIYEGADCAKCCKVVKQDSIKLTQ